MSNHYLLLQLHISRFSVGPGWHLTALYVCDKWKGEGVGIRVKKTRILTADWKQCSSGPHSTSLIRPPEASLLLSYPLCVTVPSSSHRAEPLPHSNVTPHLNRYAIKTYKADLRHLGAEISSDSTAHTPRTENSLEATKENGCPWHHSARIWFSLFSRKSDCDRHLSGQKQFIRPPRSFIKIPTPSVLRILNLLIFSKKNIQL